MSTTLQWLRSTNLLHPGPLLAGMMTTDLDLPDQVHILTSACVVQDTYDGLAPEASQETLAGRSAENKQIREAIDLEGAF